MIIIELCKLDKAIKKDHSQIPEKGICLQP